MYFGDKGTSTTRTSAPTSSTGTPGPVDDPVMRPQPGHLLRGAARARPRRRLITDNGYNPADPQRRRQGPPTGKLIYRAGQALIDPAKPTEELARALTTPFLVPETAGGDRGPGEQRRVRRGPRRMARASGSSTTGRGDAGVGVLHGRALAQPPPPLSRAPLRSPRAPRSVPAIAKAISAVMKAGKITNHTATAAMSYAQAGVKAKTSDMGRDATRPPLADFGLHALRDPLRRFEQPDHATEVPRRSPARKTTRNPARSSMCGRSGCSESQTIVLRVEQLPQAGRRPCSQPPPAGRMRRRTRCSSSSTLAQPPAPRSQSFAAQQVAVPRAGRRPGNSSIESGMSIRQIV